jgi:hypothetical protein
MENNLLLLAKVGFVLLTLVYFWLLVRLIYIGVGRTSWSQNRKSFLKAATAVGLLLWFCFVAFWSLSGIMSDFGMFPFNFMPVLLVPLLASLVIALTPATGEILNQISTSSIVHLQSFRFFVEVLLWVLFMAGYIPEQMTFEGLNYDILAGITAPAIGWLAAKGRITKTGLIIWNIGCLGLLINIVSIAILSTPSPVRIFLNEPANRVVAVFPISLLPAFLVPLAYTLHFFSLRQLLQRKDKSLQRVP